MKRRKRPWTPERLLDHYIAVWRWRQKDRHRRGPRRPQTPLWLIWADDHLRSINRPERE